MAGHVVRKGIEEPPSAGEEQRLRRQESVTAIVAARLWRAGPEGFRRHGPSARSSVAGTTPLPHEKKKTPRWIHRGASSGG